MPGLLFLIFKIVKTQNFNAEYLHKQVHISSLMHTKRQWKHIYMIKNGFSIRKLLYFAFLFFIFLFISIPSILFWLKGNLSWNLIFGFNSSTNGHPNLKPINKKNPKRAFFMTHYSDFHLHLCLRPLAIHHMTSQNHKRSWCLKTALCSDGQAAIAYLTCVTDFWFYSDLCFNGELSPPKAIQCYPPNISYS